MPPVGLATGAAAKDFSAVSTSSSKFAAGADRAAGLTGVSCTSPCPSTVSELPTGAPTPNGFDTSGNFWFAGGGGGGTWGFVGPQVGGVGGGPGGPYAGAGNGGSQNPSSPPRVVATSALENTGSGGGGGAGTAGIILGGKGGSGIVIIAYPS